MAATSREVLPAVTGLLLCGHDPNRALIEAASFGRDTDTIASVLGCLVGALHGASALQPHWIDHVEQANEDFFAEASDGRPASFTSTATDFTSALLSELRAIENRAQSLKRLFAS